MMLAMFSSRSAPGSSCPTGWRLLWGCWEGLSRGAGCGRGGPLVTSLLVDGVIAGVGGVLTFLPQIALLFLFLPFWRTSGYRARAASLWTGCCGASASAARRSSPC